MIGFFYPVVPHGKARIRTQVSAVHSREDLEFAVEAFRRVKATDWITVLAHSFDASIRM